MVLIRFVGSTVCIIRSRMSTFDKYQPHLQREVAPLWAHPCSDRLAVVADAHYGFGRRRCDGQMAFQIGSFIGGEATAQEESLLYPPAFVLARG